MESVERDRLLIREFSLFLRSFMQTKEYLQEGHVLDAYSSMLGALSHWARIAVIESGCNPEKSLWHHVRKVNPGIYKLYDELTSSSESVRKRIELVLLACEFSAMSKIENCCGVLMRIIRGRQEPWSVEELLLHPALEDLGLNLELLLNKLSSKSLIHEVVYSRDDHMAALELRYTV